MSFEWYLENCFFFFFINNDSGWREIIQKYPSYVQAIANTYNYVRSSTYKSKIWEFLRQHHL